MSRAVWHMVASELYCHYTVLVHTGTAVFATAFRTNTKRVHYTGTGGYQHVDFAYAGRRLLANFETLTLAD